MEKQVKNLIKKNADFDMQLDKIKIDLKETNKFLSSKIAENEKELKSMASHGMRITELEVNLKNLQIEVSK